MRMWKLATALAAVAWIGCSDSQTQVGVATDEVPPVAAAPAEEVPPVVSDVPVDGALSFPAGYTAWSAFLPSVDRTDNKQIRDIYLNSVAEGAAPGAPLPDGSVLVMEIYSVKVDAAGAAELGPDGRLQKNALSKIFVMEKNAGWGQGATIPNGSWVYAAFEPDGQPAQVDYTTCRACHVPMADKDYVPRLDEYFAKP